MNNAETAAQVIQNQKTARQKRTTIAAMQKMAPQKVTSPGR